MSKAEESMGPATDASALIGTAATEIWTSSRASVTSLLLRLGSVQVAEVLEVTRMFWQGTIKDEMPADSKSDEVDAGGVNERKTDSDALNRAPVRVRRDEPVEERRGEGPVTERRVGQASGWCRLGSEQYDAADDG